MKLTPGKLAGLKRVSNDRGVIAAAAMDQRSSLQKALAKEKGSAVDDATMEEFKSLVTEVLTPTDVPLVAKYADVLQIGTRNMQNFLLLRACGAIRTPVICTCFGAPEAT